MKKISSLILFILCSLFVFATPAAAKVMVEQKGSLSVAATQTIDDDLFISAESIDMAGKVTGSAFVGTGSYKMTGNIGGDLVLGAGQADITGNIAGDLYVGAGQVNLKKAVVGGNVIVGSGQLQIDKDSKIGGSVIAGTGDFKNYAPVGRNLMVGAGNIYLDSKVGKEAKLAGGNIELGSHTAIVGDLTYALDENESPLKQDPSASIAGSTTKYMPPVQAKKDMDKAKEDFAKFGKAAKGGWLFVSFLGSLLLGFALLKLFPKTGLGLSNKLAQSVLPSIGTGFLIVIAVVPVFLMLALTIIGLPIVGFLIPVLCVDLHLAKLISSYALGHFVAKQFSWNKMGVYAVYSLGLAIFFFLRAIPLIGGIASLLFTWAGLGAIWLYSRDNLKSL